MGIKWENVGGDCYRTIYITFKTEFQPLFTPIVGAMAIAPYTTQPKRETHDIKHRIKL